MTTTEAWIRAWHDRTPGLTPVAFSRGEPSTYVRLAEEVQPGDRVLDLACGDGFLLEAILARGAARAVGVDMSTSELTMARARLGGRAELVEARAQALPFPDASFDLVTCHMALMLMGELEQVAAEIRRVLAPNGRFVGIVGGGAVPGGAHAALFTHLNPLPRLGPEIRAPGLRNLEGIREVFAGFAGVELDVLEVCLDGPPDLIWREFLMSYDAPRLAPEALIALEADTRKAWASLARPDGILPNNIRFRRVRAYAAG